jgi:signal transduction histidine kinase
VHDEVANDVYHIMTKLQHQDTGNETVIDDLESVYNKTRDISREYNDLNMDEDYDQLLYDLINHYNSSKTNIITKNLSTIDWTKIQTDKKIALYRVLQELLTNMSKHSQASLVLITFQKEGSKLKIEYKDNGVGCDLKKQNGLQNAENRILASNGSITFKSQIEEGFNAIMRI